MSYDTKYYVHDVTCNDSDSNSRVYCHRVKDSFNVGLSTKVADDFDDVKRTARRQITLYWNVRLCRVAASAHGAIQGQERRIYEVIP